jgi:peptidyl-prolyl cis-trans isomerase SurA
MKKNTCFIYFFCLIGLLNGCKTAEKNKKNADSTPIVTVGGSVVSLDEFKYVYEKNNTQDSITYTDAGVRSYLDLFVNYKLKVLEAVNLKMDTSAEFRAELKHYKEQLSKPYLTDSEVNNKLVKEAYQRLGEEIRASHILLKVSTMAAPADTLAVFNKLADIRRRSTNGEDFTMLAKQFSEDPSVAQNGGDIGYFTALQMVYQFEDMAYKTPTNGISPVFRTKFGYHILKITKRRQSSGPIKVAHIMVRATEGISTEDSLAAAKKIQEIYSRLKANESWAALCEKHSDDLESRNKGGELKWFSPGNMYPTFDEAAFALQNKEEITAPVKTIYGWHLIKLLDKKPLESFETLEPVLKRKIAKDSRLEINKAHLISKIKKENQFVQPAKTEKLVISKADSTLLKTGWQYNRADKDLSKNLFTIGYQAFSLKNFFDYLEKQNPPTEKVMPAYYLKQELQNFVNKTVYDFYNEHLEENVPEYRYLMNEYRDGTLMFKIMEQNIWTKALTDTAGLQQYFAENRSKYRWKDRAEVTVYSCESQEVLRKLQAELQKDYYENKNAVYPDTQFAFGKTAIDSSQLKDLRNLAGSLKNDPLSLVELQSYISKNEKSEAMGRRIEQIRNFMLANGVLPTQIASKNIGKTDNAKKGGVKYLMYSKSNKVLLNNLSAANPLSISLMEGTVQRGENPVIDQSSWQVGTYTTADSKDKNRLHYVTIHKIIPASDKKMSETKGAVISDYQSYLETEWLKKLKEKYPVKVNEEAIKKLLN